MGRRYTWLKPIGQRFGSRRFFGWWNDGRMSKMLVSKKNEINLPENGNAIQLVFLMKQNLALLQVVSSDVSAFQNKNLHVVVTRSSSKKLLILEKCWLTLPYLAMAQIIRPPKKWTYPSIVYTILPSFSYPNSQPSFATDLVLTEIGKDHIIPVQSSIIAVDHMKRSWFSVCQTDGKTFKDE